MCQIRKDKTVKIAPNQLQNAACIFTLINQQLLSQQKINALNGQSLFQVQINSNSIEKNKKTNKLERYREIKVVKVMTGG